MSELYELTMQQTMQQTAQEDRQRILSEDYVSLIFHTQNSPFDPTEILEELLPQVVNRKYVILNAPLAEFPPDIASQGYYSIPKLFTLLDTASLEASGILRVQNQPFLNLKGRGVIIGFIDTGINYQHPAFRNPDGSSRILRIWDQTIQTGQIPEGFRYGSEYTQEQIDLALRSSSPLSIVPTTDSDGHGSAMAGIAAGSVDETAQFSGAAPLASIMVVKLKPAKQYLRDYFLVDDAAVVFQEDDCMLAVSYLERRARSLNRPLVICFGLGTNQGGHDGHTPLDEVFNSITFTAGNYAVIAGGNETGLGHHYFGKLERMGDSSEVEVVVDRETRGFTMELWAFSPELYALGVISPLGERVSPLDPRIGASQNTFFLLDRSSVKIDYEIVEFQTGSQLIQVRVENPSMGVWRFQVVNKRFLNGNFHMWLPAGEMISPYVRFLYPDPDTTLTVPSCNDNIICISTYSAYDNTLFLNSSRGYTRDNHIKPDIAAPGVNLPVPYGNSAYVRFTGSSAAASISGGAVALLVQWGMEDLNGKILSNNEVKNLLYRGAKRSEALYYPNREWGYGALDVYGIFESLI